MGQAVDRQVLKRSIQSRMHALKRVFAPDRPGNGSPSLAVLRRWQSERLEASFADVLEDPVMHRAGRFFLSDLYGDQDFSGRDRDVEKIMPVMVHLLPDSLLVAARDAIGLHALSHALDLRMVAAMEARRWRRLDQDRYGMVYRDCGLPRVRARQIALIVAVGRNLDAAVRRHGVHRILKASRLPARAAGLSELQGFLERGFDAFERLGGADRFLERIRWGEMEASRRLFAADPSPFRP
ncbi:MAG: FFLEELY motif protein [Lysobacteraceae bacterium]